VLTEVVIKKVAGNIEGDVLVISVNRAPYGKTGPIVASAQDCEDQCRLTSGCNGWTYCSKVGGCGSGCREYHKRVGASESFPAIVDLKIDGSG
jgi:hypothetical protein